MDELDHAGEHGRVGLRRHAVPQVEHVRRRLAAAVEHVADVRLNAGAGYVVVLTGAVMTMPGLPRVSAVRNIDVTDDGEITGVVPS